MKNFEMPADLSADGIVAYNAIKSCLKDFSGMHTGGCVSFYSPAEWRKRGETYGADSVLIVCYDGGDLRDHFNMDAAYNNACVMASWMREEGMDDSNVKTYSSIEKMNDALRAVGFYFEECTGWYSAIYKI